MFPYGGVTLHEVAILQLLVEVFFAACIAVILHIVSLLSFFLKHLFSEFLFCSIGSKQVNFGDSFTSRHLF